jgi:mevalonate kinase
MSIFATIAGWFKKQEASAVKVFSRIEPLLHKAEPIVQEIASLVDAETKALGSPAVLAKLNGFLKTGVSFEGVVDSFVSANTGAPVESVLHNAAALMLAYSRGNVTKVTSDIDLAVQAAYSVLKG